MLRLASAYDADDDVFGRVATPPASSGCCKRAPMFAAEAMECLGGNGYVEERSDGRLFREAPLNGIWEGSGNVIALDVQRAITREPDSAHRRARRDQGGDRAQSPGSTGSSPICMPSSPKLGDGEPQAKARSLTERLALRCKGSLLLRYSATAVVDAFYASRLAGSGGLMFASPDAVDA